MRITFKSYGFSYLVSALVLLTAVLPGTAHATQVHPAEEGVYVHQIGHIFFLVSMGILIYWLRQRKLTREPGWRFIQYSAFFFILWNIDAIVVHYLDDLEDIFELGGIGPWHRWVHEVQGHYALSLVYYIGRMDHLLCVPAIVLLFIGLKHLSKHPDKNWLPKEDRP